MNKFKPLITHLIVALGGASLMFLALTFTGQLREPTKLAELQAIIEERYIGDLDVKTMEDTAAAAMVLAIGDRWSGYIPEEEYQDYVDRVSNSYVGVGMTVQALEDGSITVVRVEPNGPAAEAGVEAGDVIAAVNGLSVEGLTTSELSAMVKGKAHTAIDITFLRNDPNSEDPLPSYEDGWISGDGHNDVDPRTEICTAWMDAVLKEYDTPWNEHYYIVP